MLRGLANLNDGVKRLLWVVSVVLTVVAMGTWGAIMLDEWQGFVARGGTAGALLAGAICLVAPTGVVWGVAAVVLWIRAGFSTPNA